MAKNFTLKDKSDKALKDIRSLTRGRLEDFADSMTEYARESSPVDTGHNKRSIDYQFLGRFDFRVFSESGYGGWLEFGTARMAARPYFAPSFQKARREFENESRWRL